MSSINTTSCLTQTYFSWINEPDPDSLCGRISSYFRMGPGLICLATSVTAACCGIVWGTYWLITLGALGACGSVYSIYLGYQFKQLKTLEESNRALREQLNVFGTNNLELGQQVNTLGLENERLGREVDRLANQTLQLNETANRYEETNREQGILISQLREEIQKLTEVRDTLYEQASKHVEHLKQLQNSFGEIRNSAESNNVIFGEKVINLSEQVELLTTSRIELTEMSSEFEKKMEEQTEALINAGKILREAFLAIQEWKDEEKVNTQIQQMEKLRQQLSERNKELHEVLKEIRTASNELYETKGILEQTKINLEGLKKIRKGFEIALQSLLEKIQMLGQENENLSQVKNEICEAANIFKEFKFVMVN